MKFKVSELIPILEKNKNAHRKVFEAAVEGFRKKQIEKFNEGIQELKRKGKLGTSYAYIVLSLPFDATKEYEQVIQMLEMTTETIIDLTQKQFGQYIRDEWDWGERFSSSNDRYTVDRLR